ncbi:SusC/RagA family TonB-linked outer membrane protein [Membranihabitans maritimus]|uniref:SusC/RagA family TonB-linked outer membrane protein n=1 Tax=Membranihabitans maritimus TaxID=2904244 RepID=UPI001F1886D1|nr:TonB-dependent receptor [Membranihabitans maritimus]
MIKDVKVEYEKKEGESIRSVLDRVLKEVNFGFKIFEDRFVIIYKNDDAGIESLEQMIRHMEGIVSARKNAARKNVKVDRLNTPSALEVYNKRLVINVSGMVTDQNGEPLIGVNVLVKGTDKGTATDFDGNFTLEDVGDQAVLVVSYIGYQTQEVPLNGKHEITITLLEDSQTLDEVVVVGYGTVKKENLTGSVDNVNMEKLLNNRPVTNITSALQGALSGVQITKSTGRPGDFGATSISIRGMMSINGGSPLILVDNVPVENIQSINPVDIESVSVLKDASSSSIYGGRAAFGVILIKTKKGVRNQKIKFNYSSNLAISWPFELPEKATALEQNIALLAAGNLSDRSGQDLNTWNSLLKDYQSNPSNYPNGATYVDDVYYHLAESDMYDLSFTNSFEQIHNFSFSGGSENSDYRVSFGYSNEDGIFEFDKDTYKKYTISGNLNTDLTRRLSSELNINYKNDYTTVPGSVGRVIYSIANEKRAINVGSHTLEDGSTLPTLTPRNILDREPPRKEYSDNLRILERLNYKVSENINVTAEYTFIKSNNNRIDVGTGNNYWDISSFFVTPINNNSSYYRNFGDKNHHAFNLYTNFGKDFGSHSFKLLVGTNHELIKTSGFNAMRLDLLSVNVPSLATSTGIMSNSETFDENAISGYFGRLNYIFLNKYLLEANVRYDGSSKFPIGNRFGLFPSFSAGWVVSEEPFMKNIRNVIDFMKIRTSWGEIGNQDVANYTYIPSMETNSSNWVDATTNLRNLSISVPALVSSTLTWETIRSKNIGIDISVLNGSINATFDYFHRLTLNMLGPGEELPATIGAAAPQKNVADLVSKGWELSLSWNKVINPGLSYSLGIKLWDDRAFVTKFDNEGGILSQYYEGYEFGEIWGYETQGFYKFEDFIQGTLDEKLLNGKLKDGIPVYLTTAITNPGDIRYVDLNGDGQISPGTNTLSNPGDRKIIGNSNRRYQFGITGNLSVKNFNISFLIQGIAKRDVWKSDQSYWPYVNIYDSFNKYELDFWTPENLDAYYPRLYESAGGNTANSRLVQTKYLLNGAYLRVKNIELNYTLPEQIIQKLTIDRLGIFLSFEDILRLDYLPKGIDTELVDIGSGLSYPVISKISCGIKLTF